MVGNISKKRVDMVVVNSIKETLSETRKVAENVNSAVEKYPYISQNGNWYVWDSKIGVFVSTGVKAEGYTPECGVDYWTEEDKAQIHTYLNEKLKTVPKMVNQEKELVCQYVCNSADYTLEGILDISVNRKLTKDNIAVYVNGKVPDGSYISDYGSGDFVIYWNGPRLHYIYAEDKMRILTGNFGTDQDGDVIEVYIENANAIKEEDVPNSIARTQYVDRLIHAKVGDIEAALLEIEAIADALIGGDA